MVMIPVGVLTRTVFKYYDYAYVACTSVASCTFYCCSILRHDGVYVCMPFG